MENQKCTLMVCLDITVFDTVDHKIILKILENYFEIAEQAFSWITSYLSNRKFSVQINQHISKIATTNFSAPEGGILGPIPFNYYASIFTEIIPGGNVNFLSVL